MARSNQIAELISRFLGSRGESQGIGSLLNGGLPYAREPDAYQMKPDVVGEPLRRPAIPTPKPVSVDMPIPTPKPMSVDYSSPVYPGGSREPMEFMPKDARILPSGEIVGRDDPRFFMSGFDSGNYGMPGFDPGADVFSNVMGKYPVASGGFDAAPAMAGMEQAVSAMQGMPSLSSMRLNDFVGSLLGGGGGGMPQPTANYGQAAMAQQLARPQAAPDYGSAAAAIARMFGGV